MSIKSNIKKVAPNDSYPILKTNGNVIILFISEGTGTVVQVDDKSEYILGEFSEFWIEHEFAVLSSNMVVELSNG